MMIVLSSFLTSNNSSSGWHDVNADVMVKCGSFATIGALLEKVMMGFRRLRSVFFVPTLNNLVFRGLSIVAWCDVCCHKLLKELLQLCLSAHWCVCVWREKMCCLCFYLNGLQAMRGRSICKPKETNYCRVRLRRCWKLFCENWKRRAVFSLRCATAQYHQTICAVLSQFRALPTF